MVMISFTFWHVTLCSSQKAGQHFEYIAFVFRAKSEPGKKPAQWRQKELLLAPISHSFPEYGSDKIL
jgi:hypothetical protein